MVPISITLTLSITLSIIGFIILIKYLICRTKYEKFEKPRSFETEYPHLKNELFVSRIIDENHVIAYHHLCKGWVSIILIGKYCKSARVKYRNPVIIGRCKYKGEYIQS